MARTRTSRLTCAGLGREIACLRQGVFRFLQLLAVGGLLWCPAWAQNQPLVRVTAGDHPYFGRVVLNAPGLSYAVNRDGDHVVIMFSNDPVLGDLPPTPRNVLAIRAVPGGIELTVPLGANVRTTRFGDKVVVDIDDTVANRPPLAPLTDVLPTPRREPQAVAARPVENSQAIAPEASGARPSLPLSGIAEMPPRETPQQTGTPPGGVQTGSAVTGGAVTGGAVNGGAVASGAVASGAATGGAVTGGAATGGTMAGSPVTGGAMAGSPVTGGTMAGRAMAGSIPAGNAPGSAATGNAAGSVAAGKVAVGNTAPATAGAANAAASAAAVPGQVPAIRGTARWPGLPDVVAPGRLRGVIAQLPLAAPTDSAEPNSAGKRPSQTGPPAEAVATSPTAAATQGQSRPDYSSSVTFAPIAQDVAAMPVAGDSRAPGAPPERPSEPAPTQQVTREMATGSPAAAPTARPDGPPAAEPASQPSPDAAASPQQAPVQVWPVTQDTLPLGPAALRAVRSRPPDGLAGVAAGLPFRGAVGAALLTRGPDIFVVFDERRPIDLSALKDDPVFGPAVVTLYPTATVMRLTSRPGQSAMLFPDPLGWRLSIVPVTPKPAAFAETVIDGGITFAGSAPGQVVAITDPRTGGTLLVGTQRTSGQGVLVERQTPEFDLPVTGQGIVVEPLSDAISLRITQAGFVLSAGSSGLALSPPQPMPEATIAAARLTRRFEFPRQATETLVQRAKQQKIAAARTPLLRRGPLRRALAESMLGLGRGAEAQTVLQVTMKDDPREAESPTTIGLAAIAALLANRPAEAGGITDPRLTGTDEVALWRAILLAMQDKASPAAAAVLATTAPLLFTYPAQMRDRLLPLAMETMIRGGQSAAAAPLLAEREDDPSLAFARAMLKQAQGDNAGALILFDALANGRSDRDHARAATRATELRLAMGKIDNKAAADAMEGQLYAWRGGRSDLALRLRIAELRQKDGEWRSVFATLRRAWTEFPDHAPEIDRRLKDAFAAVAHDPSLAKMEPTELIAMLDENAELMPDGADGEPMRALLAQKLMALDLPKQADPLLMKLMRAAPFGPARAGFGATLATLRLREGDADGALLALSESNSADMDDPVRQRRSLITARVEAQRGKTDEAVATLAGDQTIEADEARAAILEHAQAWPAARDALARLAARVVPDSGMLDDAQLRVVLRLATAAARADDDATLASLRDKLGARIGSGAQGDMFRLLTAPPVRGTSDLPRARADLGAIRSLADDMAPKKTAASNP